ncbi:MAG: beta-propeller domain-containing protein [Actinobacteria bacterium]|nr:beta-propeller domain-containing protein [Actinomycetota bacterium]
MRSRTIRTARLGLAAVAATVLVAVPATGAASSPSSPLFDIPAPEAGVPSFHDGDPATTERLLRGEKVTAAATVSKQRFAAVTAEGRHAAFAVLARSDDFADALAGSSLLGDAPLLLTSGKTLDGRVTAELDRILADGATVYLLGGERALGRSVADAVAARGFEVVRLAGASRVETSIAVAKEAKRLYGRKELLVARAFGTDRDPSAAWADSVAAGGLAATLGVPLVVTPTAAVHPAVARFVAASDPTRTVVLGGPAALSAAVESALPNAVRVAGADRTATAAAIATEAWGAPTSGARRNIVVNGGQPDGWALGLVAAGLSADARAPIVLVTEHLSAPVRALVRTCGEPQVDLAVMGDGTRVSPSVRERLDILDGDACGAGGAIRTQQELEGFPGCEDVLAYYRELALERVGPWGLDGGFTTMPVEEGAPAAGGDVSDGGGDTRDVSGTNVQESGVDEPDIVKTDGDRALAIAQGQLQVLDLRGTRPVVAATVSLPDGGHELLLDGTRALVLSRTYTPWGGGPEPMPEPLPTDTRTASSSMIAPSGTTLTLLDVTVPSRPVTVAEAELEGEYRAARLIDGTVRVVLQTAPGPFAWTYPEDDSANELERAAEANRQLVRDSTIEDWLATFTTTGAVGTTTADGLLAPCASIAAPPRPSDLGTVTVATYEMDGDLTPTSGAGIAASSDTVYASTDRLVVATQRWVGWTPDTGDTGTTELHSFDITDPAATRYVASGAVSGFLVNQFALSQHEGHLRVAATEGAPWGDQPSSSSTLSVLAEDGTSLQVVGRVGGLGQGERIFAVRFMGDLAAVVTFRQVDPLYLIDLSDPRAPRMTGELKVPGFSTYLHPVGEDLLIGVGQDADEEGRTLGTQVATYDISDLGHPRQVATQVYPDAYSEAEFDHRAFLHWPTAGLTVVPLDEWREDASSSFHGAVGLDVGATGSLAERGRISHPSGDEHWPATVRRSFVVDDLLYTLSEIGLRADRIDTLDQVSWTPFA